MKSVIKVGSSYHGHQNKSNKFLFCFQSSNLFNLCYFWFYGDLKRCLVSFADDCIHKFNAFCQNKNISDLWPKKINHFILFQTEHFVFEFELSYIKKCFLYIRHELQGTALKHSCQFHRGMQSGHCKHTHTTYLNKQYLAFPTYPFNEHNIKLQQTQKIKRHSLL